MRFKATKSWRRRFEPRVRVWKLKEVPAYPGSPGVDPDKRPLNGCVCVCVCVTGVRVSYRGYGLG